MTGSESGLFGPITSIINRMSVGWTGSQNPRAVEVYILLLLMELMWSMKLHVPESPAPTHSFFIICWNVLDGLQQTRTRTHTENRNAGESWTRLYNQETLLSAPGGPWLSLRQRMWAGGGLDGKTDPTGTMTGERFCWDTRFCWDPAALKWSSLVMSAADSSDIIRRFNMEECFYSAAFYNLQEQAVLWVS